MGFVSVLGEGEGENGEGGVVKEWRGGGGDGMEKIEEGWEGEQ